MKIIRGKKALVTGAASGIGRAIALELAKEGAELFLIDIDREKLADTARELAANNVNVVTACCDLSEPAQISSAVAELHRVWGGLNILVNNAGINHYGPLHLMADEHWRRIMAVNLMAPVQLFRELLPCLVAADEAHVLNVCSMFGLVTAHKMIDYQTAKFGLVGFTAGLRADYYRANFGVTALCPGFVRTEMIDGIVSVRSGRGAGAISWLSTTPEKVAARAVRAIRKDEGMVVITPFAHVCSWLARLFPGLVDWGMREGWRRRKKWRSRSSRSVHSLRLRSAVSAGLMLQARHRAQEDSVSASVILP
jgi:3-oxoacyl-[acyl-carrier protein] reductase